MRLSRGYLFLTKLSVFALSAVLIIGLVSCGGKTKSAATGGNGEKIVLRLAEAQPDNYPDTIAEKAFAQMVKERTNGRIEIQVYAGGQLGDEKTTIEQAQVGAIDIGRANSGPMTQVEKKFGIFSFPFLFKDRDHLWRVLDGEVGNQLLKSLEAHNMVGLAFYDTGARNFYTTKPMRTLADLKGMKIRVMQNDILVKAFNLLGASATPLSAAEVYSALQTGVIDGGENNFSTYVSDGHYEVAKYYTLSGHLRIPQVLFMSKASWDKLSPEDQQIIKQAAKDSEKVQIQEYDKLEKMSEDKVKAKGNQIIALPDQELQAFRDKEQPLYDEYKAEFGDFFTKIAAAAK